MRFVIGERERRKTNRREMSREDMEGEKTG